METLPGYRGQPIPCYCFAANASLPITETEAIAEYSAFFDVPAEDMIALPQDYPGGAMMAVYVSNERASKVRAKQDYVASLVEMLNESLGWESE